jgi:hypothetical protein
MQRAEKQDIYTRITNQIVRRLALLARAIQTCLRTFR